MPKYDYNGLSKQRIEQVRKEVRIYNRKLDYARKKGVSENMLPKRANADKILRELSGKPYQLRSRMKEIRDFTTTGAVYKTKGGLRTTKYIFDLKKKKQNLALKKEKRALDMASDFDLTAREYHERRINRLNQSLEFASNRDLQRINFSYENLEDTAHNKRIAVANFKSSIAYAYANADGELDMLYPKFNERLNRRLNALTVDEITDMMENNGTVKAIMEYYREKESDVEYTGNSYFDLLWQFDEELPSIIKHYKYIRKKHGTRS